MPLITHTPTDNRLNLYGKTCREMPSIRQKITDREVIITTGGHTSHYEAEKPRQVKIWDNKLKKVYDSVIHASKCTKKSQTTIYQHIKCYYQKNRFEWYDGQDKEIQK